MKKNFKLAAFIMVFAAMMAFGLQSCGTQPLDKSKLDGYWVLTELNGKDAKELFKGSIPTIEFNLADTLVSGNAGCNRYFGKFDINDQNEFLAPNLASTMMTCVYENQEPLFIETLSKPATIAINEKGELTLTNKENVVVIKFTKGEKPEEKEATAPVTMENLIGKWILKSMADKNVSDLFKDKMPTIEFANDSTVNGYAGCNNYRSKYEINEESVITFGSLMSTKMACPSLDGENQFSIILSTPSQVTINDSILSFIKDGINVAEFSKVNK